MSAHTGGTGAEPTRVDLDAGEVGTAARGPGETPRQIAVVLTDDHPIVRAGLRAVLEAEPDMRVVADFGSAEELLGAIEDGLRADVVCLDLRFGPGRLGGAEAAARLTALGGPPVLILTTYDSDAEILAAVEAGATGYLLKDAPTAELTAAIRAASAGQVALGPSVQKRLLGRMRTPQISLTQRELQVLSLVARGGSNDDVAAELFVSRATVKTHLVHIFDKLGVDSRTAAVDAARTTGLLAQ